MKKILFLLLLVFFAFYSWEKMRGNSFYFGKTTLANHTLNTVLVFGPLLATRMTINRLTVQGTADIDSSQIGESMKINGPLQIFGSHLKGSLEVEGPAALKKTTVDGFTVIHGSLNASESTFNNFLNIYASKIKLSAVTVNGDLIIKGQKKSQILELEEGVHIKGAVLFESGSGTIIRDDNSVIEGPTMGVLNS